MKIKKLNNGITHQIVDEDNTIVLQGTYDDCLDYMTERFLNKIKTTPGIMDVFKRLADR
jgi:hypothetical protein